MPNADTNGRVDVDRRTCLAAVGAAGASALAGCISGSTEDHGTFEADRTADEPTGACVEEELVDESFLLAGRVLSLVHRSAAMEWQVDMQPGEELEVYTYKRNPRESYGLPGIEILDPDGRALVDKGQPSSNRHVIESGSEGTYTVRVRTRYYTENYHYSVTITWYDDTGCAGGT